MTGMAIAASGKRLTFMGLIAEYGHIEVPMIQRDYAHGRLSAAVVRSRFLDNLFDALRQGKVLSLDFVYGELGEAFTPIDGQQRLTTLFLLHWIMSIYANRLPDFQRMMIDGRGKARFGYATRPASSRFFQKLLSNPPLDPAQSMSQQIKDSPWFFRAWRHDPTVAGSLVMLDEMQRRLHDDDAAGELFERLMDSEAPRITVDALNIGNLGLSDEIYVKMNARGKELTGFEKFKAWLMDCHTTLVWPATGDEDMQWPIVMDCDWLDLFWTFHHGKPNPAESAGNAYFRTMVALATNFHAANGSFNSKWETSVDGGDENLWAQIFTEESLPYVFQRMSLLSSRIDGVLRIATMRDKVEMFLGSSRISTESLLYLFEEDSGRVSLEARLWLHALCVCLVEGIPDVEGKQEHWFRVVRNLISNNEIDADKYKLLLLSLENLGKVSCGLHDGDVLRALSEAKPRIQGGDGPQVEQEILKASRMCQEIDGGAWEAAIVGAESHVIFDGEVSLIMTDECSLDVFQSRQICISSLLGRNGSKIGKADDWLLLRAVLAVSGNIEIGFQKRIVLDGKLKSWADLLNSGSRWREVSREIKQAFRNGFLVLTDRLRGEVDLMGAARQIVDGFQKNQSWLSDLVLYGPTLLHNSKYKKVQNYYNQGIYVFAKSNWAEEDMLLGPVAWMRNELIGSMLAIPDGPWGLDRPERSVAVDHRDQGLVMYAGHAIQLNRQATHNNIGIYCQLYPGYLELGISSVEDSNSVAVDYPESFSLLGLKRRLEERLGDPAVVRSEPLRIALGEICNACGDWMINAGKAHVEEQQDSGPSP